MRGTFEEDREAGSAFLRSMSELRPIACCMPVLLRGGATDMRIWSVIYGGQEESRVLSCDYAADQTRACLVTRVIRTRRSAAAL